MLGVSGAIFDSGDITGSVVISSAPLIGVSGLIFTGGKMTGSFAPKGIGSVVIKSAPLIGVSGAIFDSGDITGSVVISSSTKIGVSGIVDVASMPDINVTEDSVAEIGTEHLGSGAVVGGVSNGSMFPFIMALGSFALTAGSITSIPTTTVAATDLDIRDLSSASDSVEITGTSEIGSVVISSAPLIGISGGIFIDGKMTGSMAMKGIGSMVISSSNLIGISGGIFVGGKIVGSFAPKGIGSVVIKGAPVLGVSGAIFDSGDITGSVVISSSTLIGISGGKLDNLGVTSMPTVTVTASNLDIRDLSSAQDSVEITGTSEIGSVVISSASLIGVSGGIFDSGNITGSVVISSAPLIGVSGVKLNKLIGSVTIGRVAEVSGGIFTGGNLTGSIAIQNEITMQDTGSPCFKTSYLIASGAWSQTWTIGGAGSKLEIHGWHISTDLPGQVRVLISGIANNAYNSGLIANYFINFASGGVVEKTFVSPIIPAGAGSAIGFGTSSAGSTNFTIYGREVK